MLDSWLVLTPVSQGLNSQKFEASACAAVVANLKATLNAELDPVFDAFETGADALASIVDYALVPFDGDAGKTRFSGFSCSNTLLGSNT